MAEHTPTMPMIAPHHWDSPEGREMAVEYSTLLRNQLVIAKALNDDLVKALDEIIKSCPFVEANDHPFNEAISQGLIALARAKGGEG